MLNDETITSIADELVEAGRTRTPVKRLTARYPEMTIEDSYKVQGLWRQRSEANGRRLAGRKIGLTSEAVQQQFGVFQPDFGLLFSGMLYGSSEPMLLDNFLQPRVEAEIAFVLGGKIENPDASVADVMRATEFVLAAIEVVDSRIAGWDITITDTVADNASSGAVVLGTTPYSLLGLDLAAITMEMEHNGGIVSSGSGAACMGSPVIAMAWLAREAARRGQPLSEGDVVLSGALGPLVSVAAPGRYRARLNGLGSIDASFVESLPS